MADPAPKATPSASRGLAGALLTASLMPLNSTMIAVAVPSIARSVDHDPADVTQALVATYLIVAIALQGPGGKLADRLGHWRVCTLGQVVIGLGALLGFLAPDLPVLACSRVLMATGGALAVPAVVALLRIEIPSERRGRAFGMFGAIMASAAALGPVVGGILVDTFSWEAVFVANLPVLLVSALLMAGVDRRRRTRPDAAFDWPGSLLITVALALLVVGVQRTDRLAALLVTAGLLVLGAFVAQERRAADPVVAFGIFRARAFTAGTLLICLQNLVMYALLFELPLVLVRLFGIGAGETGRMLLFLLVAMVLMSLVAGRLTERLGPRTPAVAGSAVCLGAMAMLLTGDLASDEEVRLPLVLLGIGLGLCGPAAQSASVSAIAPAQSGMAAGVGSTMRYLGGVTGIALLGRLLDVGGSDAAVRTSHHAMVAVFTGVLLVGLGCAALLPRRRGATARARAGSAA